MMKIRCVRQRSIFEKSDTAYSKQERA